MGMAAQSRPTVILTRPAEASARFAAQLRARFGDVAVLISPLMAPVLLTPPLPAHWDGVIFTSETGVAGLARLTAQRGPAVCVGPRTAQAAQAQGWEAEPLGGDAERLLAALVARGTQGHWLHARGRDSAGDLAQRLDAAGWQVTPLLVYAQEEQHLTSEARLVLERAAPVVVAVFSPRSAAIFAAQAGRVAAPLQVAAISPAAAAPMQALAPGRVELARTPDAPGMLDALGRILGKDGGAQAAQVYR